MVRPAQCLQFQGQRAVVIATRFVSGAVQVSSRSAKLVIGVLFVLIATEETIGINC